MTSVYISNESIQVIIGQKSGKKLKIKKIITEPVAEGCILNGVITDDAALKSQLSELWAAYKLPKKGLHLMLESSSVNTKVVTLPNVSKQSYMLKLLAESFPDADDGEAVYDYKPLSASPDGGITVLGCQTERAFVKSYIELFESAKLKLECIDLALTGQIRMAQFCKALSERTYILVVIDKNTVSQFLFINGQYRFSNRQRVIYNRDTPELADELARLLSSMVQFNKSEKSGAEITDIYFCGFSDNEINSAALMLDGTMTFGYLPPMDEIVYPAAADNRWFSGCALSAGNLI